jgi:hypothetical protein
VKAGWKANAPGAAEEEAEKKSILYPKGRTREIAEMEKMFDDKLGPHVRWIFNIQWETLGEMQDGYRTFGREKSESVRIKEILNFSKKAEKNPECVPWHWLSVNAIKILFWVLEEASCNRGLGDRG